MSGYFERYEERKEMWFWMMLSLGAVVSEDPDLSAKKTDHLVKDFIESASYRLIFDDELFAIARKYYG